MAASSVVVKAQVDAALKQSAESTLRALGLDITSAIRMFLSQIVLHDGIPFDVAVPHPNRTTQAAIADSFAVKPFWASRAASSPCSHALPAWNDLDRALAPVRVAAIFVSHERLKP